MDITLALAQLDALARLIADQLKAESLLSSAENHDDWINGGGAAANLRSQAQAILAAMDTRLETTDGQVKAAFAAWKDWRTVPVS